MIPLEANETYRNAINCCWIFFMFTRKTQEIVYQCVQLPRHELLFDWLIALQINLNITIGAKNVLIHLQFVVTVQFQSQRYPESASFVIYNAYTFLFYIHSGLSTYKKITRASSGIVSAYKKVRLHCYSKRVLWCLISNCYAEVLHHIFQYIISVMKIVLNVWYFV